MTHTDPATGGETGRRPTAAELFAGVGGFHLALDRAGFDVVWSNQWEPATKAQHAFDCYERHVRAGDFQRYGRGERGMPTRSDRPRPDEHEAVNEDIAKVLDEFEARGACGRSTCQSSRRSRTSTSLVGGFPCQDYSVAKTTATGPRAGRQEGRPLVGDPPLLRLKLATGRPVRYLFLENVDRLIKSPSGQRGRDFAVMLASLADLGYEVEWRVVNAADYGFPQKRRRVFIIGRLGRVRRQPVRPDLPPASWLELCRFARRAVRLDADAARPRRKGSQRHVQPRGRSDRRSGMPVSCASARVVEAPRSGPATSRPA